MTLNIRPLSQKLQEKAIKELNELPDRLEQDIECLKEWLLQNPQIKARTDDQILVNFLRGSKFNMGKSRSKIETFYKVRTKSPELIRNRDPLDEKLEEISKLGFGLVLPSFSDPDAPRIILVRAGIYDPHVYSLEDILKYVILLQDFLLKEDDNFIIAGQIVIIDLLNVKLAHLLQYTPGILKKFFTMTQNASPGRLRGYHFINVPYNFHRIFGMFTFFMSEKMKERASIHGSDYTSLYKYVEKKDLPEEYGGENGTVESMINSWHDKIIENRDYLIEEELFGIDESLAEAKPKRLLFGLF